MNHFIIFIILMVVAIVINVGLHFAKRSFTMKTMGYLYQQGDAKKYLEALDSFNAKILFSKKTRLFMKIDGHTQLKQVDEVLAIFKQLRGMRLSYGKKITLYQKEVGVYVEQKMNEEAIASYDDLVREGSLLQDQRMIQIIENNGVLVDVYAKKNPEVTEQLKQIITSTQDQVMIGIMSYRLAVCSHHQGDHVATKKYLKEAQVALKGTLFEALIGKVISDQKLIDNYVL